MKFIAALLILICSAATAQDTTYVTYSFTHDSLIQTTIPEQIYISGYDTTINEGGNFRAYYDNQLYAEVTGDVTVITPDYDTIPEHDTVFICTLCATHDTTVIVIIPVEPDEEINGMFPNPGTFTPLASRIHTAKIYGSNAFRDNTDVGTNWKVKQVHDSGMIDLMTYNDPPCCGGLAFRTGSAVNTALTTLNNYLTNNPNDLPELISFNNEEPNFGYWEGTANDYLNWLNAATIVAHNHGIPVSNGGILHNFFWYMRYVYQQEGKTDSVNYINNIMGIGPSTPAFAQVVIDWYKIEIPGLAASDIDYVNFHNYYDGATPQEMNLVNLTIRFLGSRTGKPVITTEAGTRNASQAEFNEYFSRMRAEGVPVIVYYNGTGPLAEEHPDWWLAWLLQ